MNEALTIAGAIFALLAAIYFQRKDVTELKADMIRSMEALRAEMHAGFAQVDARFAQVDARFAQVDARFAQVDARFAEVNSRFDQMGGRIDRMQGDINTFATVNALHDHRISTLEATQKN